MRSPARAGDGVDAALGATDQTSLRLEALRRLAAIHLRREIEIW